MNSLLGLRTSSEKSNNMPSSLVIKAFSTISQINLIDLLRKEYDEEVESGNVEMPQELSDLKASILEDWRMVEDQANSTLFLKSKKVQVSFHCQDTVEELMYDDQEAEGDEEPILPIRFTVSSSKAGKSLVLDCLSELGQARIVGVKITTLDADEDNAYQGPDFAELDEDLQDAYHSYLKEELAVTSDIAVFIAMTSDYKEQMQYVQFLKDSQSIVS
jgi:complement component 1 Q subcomponent-binding protein